MATVQIGKQTFILRATDLPNSKRRTHKKVTWKIKRPGVLVYNSRLGIRLGPNIKATMKIIITGNLPFQFETNLGNGLIYLANVRANVPAGGFTVHIGSAYAAIYTDGDFSQEPPLLLSKLGTGEEMAAMIKAGIEVPDDLYECDNKVAVLIESLRNVSGVKIVG